MVQASEKRILVVDDEQDVREFLSTCLRDVGFQVDTAIDGFDALAQIDRSPPDLITLDLLMPRISGIKMMRKLRKNPAWKQIPVIIITAHAKDQHGKKDLNDLYAEEVAPVPEHILEKPITPSRLVDGICNILRVKTIEEPETDRDQVMDMIRQCSSDKLKEIQGLLA